MAMPNRIVPLDEWVSAHEEATPMFAEPDTYTPNLGPSAAVEQHSTTAPGWRGIGGRSSSRAAYMEQDTLRNKSLSLPWRGRPKSLVILGNGDWDAITARSGDLPQGLQHAAGGWHHAYPHGQASSRTQKADTGSLRGMFRRASVSLKGMVHKRTATSSSSRAGEVETPDEMTQNHRPGTSHSPWQRLRQATNGLRHSRSLYTVDGARDTASIHGYAAADPNAPIPGIGGPPVIPRNSGAAAKAAVALQNEYLHYGLELPGSGSGPNSRNVMSVQQHPPHNKWLAAAVSGGSHYDDDGASSSAANDRESGIGIAVANSDCGMDEIGADEMDVYDETGGGPRGVMLAGGPDFKAARRRSPRSGGDAISRVDFVASLPVELAILILSYLDAPVLAQASRVSRRWHYVANTQHIWRESFLREKTGTYAMSGPAPPGRGLGVPTIMPDNNWKEIYRVKEELDKKWEGGKARPVYLNGHLDSIYCLQFDESKIITGSRDKTVRIWDMHTFECKLVIGPPEVINDVALLFDEQGQPVHYATLHDGQRAALSVPATASFPMHHKASILCLQYDDRILVTGSSDASCIIYSVRSAYRPIRRLRHHGAAVLDLAFDARHIVTCSKDVSICVWDRATGALLRQLRGHSGPVNAVQMRGNTIVSCSGDFKVKLWNVDTGKNIREFVGHTKGLACSQFSEDGRYIASAGNDKVIRVWDANTGECLREMRAHENLVRSLHIDSVSGRLVSGSYDTDIKVFDMETGRQLLDFPKWHQSWVLSAKSDYRRIVSTGQDPKILIMDFGAEVRGVEMLESCPRGQGGYI